MQLVHGGFIVKTVQLRHAMLMCVCVCVCVCKLGEGIHVLSEAGWVWEGVGTGAEAADHGIIRGWHAVGAR